MSVPIRIAEIGSNHNGSLERCLKIVDYAADLGLEGVKIQLFRIRQLYHVSIIHLPQIQEKQKYEVPLDWLPRIRRRCDEHGLSFGITPCHEEAVAEAAEWADWLKISSYDLCWDHLCMLVTKTGKPVVASCGLMDGMDLAGRLKDFMRWGCKDLTILHCCSEYPASLRHVSLNRINLLKLKVPEIPGIQRVGYSDHTGSEYVLETAIRYYGAAWVEFHLDLFVGTDGMTSKGAEWAHSWPNVERDGGFDYQLIDHGPWLNESELPWCRDEDGFRPRKEIRNTLIDGE